MAFDLKTLKPGDEVGIQADSHQFASRVATTTIKAIHDDGVFELDSGDWFDQDGRCAWNPESRRLGPPTDEGRLAVLQETIYEDLCKLQDKARSLPLDRLRKLRETVLGLLAETGRD